MIFKDILVYFVYKFSLILRFDKDIKSVFYKILKAFFIILFIIPYALFAFIDLVLQLLFVIPSSWPIIGVVLYWITKIFGILPGILMKILMIPDAIYKTAIYDLYANGLEMGEDFKTKE